MSGFVYLQRNAFLDAAPDAERHAERIPCFVQRPVLIVCFEWQHLEPLYLCLCVGIADRLIYPGRTDLRIGKRLCGEFPALFLWDGKHPVGEISIERLQP